MRKKESILVEVEAPQIEPTIEAISWRVRKEHFDFYIHKSVEGDYYYINIESEFFQHMITTEHFYNWEQVIDFINLFND